MTATLAIPKIIAEVAQGYEGKPDYCDFYVRAAARAGADAVKFQIVYADDVSEPGYQYYDWYKQLEMPRDAWVATRDRAHELDIRLFVDVSGARALDMARTIEPDGIKFHSSNFFNRALMREALAMAEQLFVSIGGIAEPEIAALLEDLAAWEATDRTTLLYGYQAEPTPVEMSCLARLPTLRRRFPQTAFGFLDHAPGDSPDNVHVSLLAMALGAVWIEKHITINRHLEVEDYVSALEPAEFTDYVATLRRLAAAFGPPDLALNEAERNYRDKSVKKLLAARDLPAGTTLAATDLLLKRTPRIPAFAGFHDPAQVIGRQLSHALAADAPILAEDFS